MKPIVWAVALLIALAGGLAAIVMTRGPRPGHDCAASVVIVRSPSGHPLECVCIEGALSACFDPGP